MGSPALSRQGQAVRLPYQRAMALLAYLIVEGHAVDRTTIKALLWEDVDNQRASSNLRQAVYAIGQTLPGLVVSQGTSLTLNRELLWTDIEVMQASTADLLSLRRGPLCEGLTLDDALAFETWLMQQRERHDTLFVQACLARAAIEERSGRWDSAIAAARRAVATAPWLESAHRELIRLLHGSGDVGAALHQYQETTRILEEEVGSGPSPEMAGLFSGVWTAGLLPTSKTQQFMGRAAELQALERHVFDRPARLITVSGPAGMGKTTLVARFVEEAPRRGVRVVFQSLYAAESYPLDRIFELVLETLESTETERLRAVWHGRTSVPGRVDLLIDIFRKHRCLIVLDNCEEGLSADFTWRPEFSDLACLLERIVDVDHRATLILTSRHVPRITARDPARSALLRVEVPLTEGLAPRECASLLQHFGIQGDLELLMEVAERCAGVPRTIESVAGTLRQRRTLTLERLVRHTNILDRLVSQPWADLYERLREGERAVMELLAVSEHPLSPSMLTSVLGDVEQELGVLEAHFALEVDTAGNCFLHPATRQWLNSHLDRERQTELHLGLASALAACRRTGHWTSLDDFDAHLRAIRNYRAAGRPADGVGLFGEIARQLLVWGHFALAEDIAGKLAREAGDQSVAHIALGYHGMACGYQMKLDEAHDSLQRAMDLAEQAGDLVFTEYWAGHLGICLHAQHREDEARACYERALELARATGNSARYAVNLGWLGSCATGQGRYEEATVYLEEALGLAQAFADPRAECEIRRCLGVVMLQTGDTQGALRLLATAVQMAAQHAATWEEGMAIWRHAEALMVAGDLKAAASLMDQAIARSRHLNDGLLSARLLSQGRLNWLRGKSRAARRCFEEASALPALPGADRSISRARVLLMGILAGESVLGVDDEMAPLLHQRPVDWSQSLFQAGFEAALLLEALGRTEASQALFQETAQACPSACARQMAERELDLVRSTIGAGQAPT